jgi:hypothetical protein
MRPGDYVSDRSGSVLLCVAKENEKTFALEDGTLIDKKPMCFNAYVVLKQGTLSGSFPGRVCYAVSGSAAALTREYRSAAAIKESLRQASQDIDSFIDRLGKCEEAAKGYIDCVSPDYRQLFVQLRQSLEKARKKIEDASK